MGSFPYPSHPSAGGTELPRGVIPLRRVVPRAVTRLMAKWFWQMAPVGCQAGAHKDQACTVVPSFIPHCRGDTQGGRA